MTTPPPDKQVAVETLEEIAQRISQIYPCQTDTDAQNRREIFIQVHMALRNERERCAKVATDHYAKGSAPECEGGEHCGIAIAKAIREGK